MTRLQAAQLIENLPEVLKSLRDGEGYILCEGSEPIATLMPYADKGAVRASSLGAPPGDDVHHSAEEETDDDGFRRDLEEGVKENAELLRRLAR